MRKFLYGAGLALLLAGCSKMEEYEGNFNIGGEHIKFASTSFGCAMYRQQGNETLVYFDSKCDKYLSTFEIRMPEQRKTFWVHGSRKERAVVAEQQKIYSFFLSKIDEELSRR